MSTVTAFVHSGDWNADSRKHPALDWFEKVLRDIFDAQRWDTPHSELYADNLQLLKPDGSEVNGGKEAWEHVAQMFGPLSAQRTQPVYVVISETDYGWDMIGNALIFGNLHGEPGKGEEKVKDVDGQSWDLKMPIGSRFQFVKNAGGPRDGILLKAVHLAADSFPVLTRMVSRGLVKPADLGF